MKKMLLLMLLVLFTISVNAQFSVGVRGGLNLSSIQKFEPFELKSKASFHAGVFGRYMFDTSLGIESGIYYSALGGKYVDNSSDFELTLNPNYLQVPVSVLYGFKLGNDFTLFPAIGVYLGYGIGGKAKAKGLFLEDMEFSPSQDYFNEYNNRFDMGVIAGLHLQYKRVILSAGYEQGFMKINKEQDEESGANVNILNGNFRISLGFLF